MKNLLRTNIQFFAENDEEEDVDSVEETEEEESEDLGFVDGSEDENVNDSPNKDATPKTEEVNKQKQSKETNAYFKQKRLEEKAQKDAIEKAKFEGTKEGLFKSFKGINPFTKEKLVDDVDYQELMDMIEIDKNGSEDVVADYRVYRKQKDKELLNEKSKESAKGDFIQKDIVEFNQKLGDKYDISKLINDEDFLTFCGDDLGQVSLVKLVDRYEKYNARINTKISDNLIKKQAVKESAVGGLTGSKTKTNEEKFFTREEVKAMTQSQVKKNFDRIQASMKQWDK